MSELAEGCRKDERELPTVWEITDKSSLRHPSAGVWTPETLKFHELISKMYQKCHGAFTRAIMTSKETLGARIG